MSCCWRKQWDGQGGSINPWRYWGGGIGALLVWMFVYSGIGDCSSWLVYESLGQAKGSALGEALRFFFFDTAKIFLLLLLIVYVSSWLRAGVSMERIRAAFSGKRSIGYVLAAVIGALTPFCSCSSIPLFISCTMAGIPFGIAMTFLITSPLINEVAVVMLWEVIGWKYALIYIGVGLLAGCIGGILMDLLRVDRWLKSMGHTGMVGRPIQRRVGLLDRHRFAVAEVVGIFRRVWLWIVLGVAVGAALHGYVPEQWFAQTMGADQLWSVPLAVGMGIPLYTNVTGVVPVMESLLGKGLPIGTTMAFCMSTVAVSLPELLMLRQCMRWQLLAVFLGILLGLFTLIGWLLNAVSL